MPPDPWTLPDTGDAIARRLRTYWEHGGIPLAEHIGVEIVEITGQHVTLGAPLEPNLNHMGTGFAGSISSLATLTGWAACQTMVQGLPPCDAMVHDCRIRFIAPVRGDMQARCSLPPDDAVEAFRRRLGRRGRAHLELAVEVLVGGVECAALDGRFVAVLDADGGTDRTRSPAK